MAHIDSRKVKELWVINSLANPRPTLETYKYEMPGEKEEGVLPAANGITTMDTAISVIMGWLIKRQLPSSWRTDILLSTSAEWAYMATAAAGL
jgi:hypothetical protein